MRKSGFFRTILAVLVLHLAPGAMADEPLDLDVYQGKVVVLDFWASWCVPCRRSFPWLNAMSETYEDDGLIVVGVNLDKEREDALRFLQEYPADFRITYDPEAALAKEFGVQGMPSSYVIGRDGRVREQHIGFKMKRRDEYEAAIVAALGETTE